jgi:sugar phosphate isomerase/epimerase
MLHPDLSLLTASVAALWLTPAALAAEPDPVDRLGWQLGIHSYTFSHFSIFDAIDQTAALGLHAMSISGSVSLDGKHRVRTMDLAPKDWDAIAAKLSMAGIKLYNMGVVELPADETACRKVFEFARRVGLDTLVSEPEPAALDVVEKLCREYHLKVAFHNHPKPSRYWDPHTTLAAIRDRDPLLGVCADTGHWVRSGVDPVEALKLLSGRVLCFHLKDVSDHTPQAQDVPWGTGVGQVKEILAEARRQGFRGPFLAEHEAHMDNPMPDLIPSVAYFKACCAAIVGS